MDVSGKNVLVLGLGMSGRSAANFCAARGAKVTAADEAPASDLSELDSLASGIAVSVGCEWPDPADFDLVVPSPGIAASRYEGRAKHVAGDIELAGAFLQIPIVAVTGTNGKSTTVSLVEVMLQHAGLRAKAAGNLGTPALSLVGAPLDVAVLEVSSFQLEATRDFAPRVAAVLNISPDHLDRHGSFEAYRDAKAAIFANQRPDDVAVLNADDAECRDLAASCAARVILTSRRGPTEDGAFLDSGAIVVRHGAETQRFSLDGLKLAGVHNLENVLAAVAIVDSLGVDPAAAIGALRDFPGLPHRCEVIATVSNVRFINDSKATNPGAAQSSIEGFDEPVVWLAGGRGKGLAFDRLADVAATRVKAAVLYGESASQLEDALAGRVPVDRTKDLSAAVTVAWQRAEPGDVVLLAPACASFDQFKSFTDRGDHFRAAVQNLDPKRASHSSTHHRES